MNAVRQGWDFIQNQMLGMQWLQSLVRQLLAALGLDPAGRPYGIIQFFIYDTIKILLLLCALIFIISYIQSYYPPQRTKRILGRFHGLTANILAALLGTVTPFCSCSSIPLFIGFTSAGLPLGVTFSFLISSPMVDLGSLVILADVFGLMTAIIYVLLGLVVAVIGGTLIGRAGLEGQLEDVVRNARLGQADAPAMTRRERLVYAKEQMLATLKKVGPYVLVGVAIGAVVHNVIPREWIESILSSRNPFSVILATLVGIPIYADIFSSIPVANALLGKGAGLGTVLSFMMAVTTLSLPSMIMLRKAVKPRLLAVFVGIVSAGIILVGYFFNWIQPWLVQSF